MSLSMWLDRTLQHERSTSVRDAIGGNVPTWATQTASVPCAVWPAGVGIGKQFARRDFVGSHVIVTDRDLSLLPKDRILIGSTYYVVNGFELYNNAFVGGETCYVIDASVRTV